MNTFLAFCKAELQKTLADIVRYRAEDISSDNLKILRFDRYFCQTSSASNPGVIRYTVT